MRILIFTHAISRHKNDHPQFINELCLAYQQLGHASEILTSSHSSIKPQLLDPNIKFSFYRYGPKWLERLGYGESLENDLIMKPVAYCMAPFMLIMGLLALRKKTKKFKPDFVHAHWGLPNGFIAALALIGTKTKLMISFPGSDVTAIALNPLLKAFGMFACKKADILTTNSHDLRDTLITLGADKNKFHFVLYGSDNIIEDKEETIQKQLKNQYAIQTDEKVILAIGRLVPKKGFIYLIRALARIRHLYQFKLIIIGEGLEKQKLQQAVKEGKLEQHVIFAGRIPYSELSQYYHLADIFANPAVRVPVDGLNVVVAEAMKYKLPIAGTNVGGNELVVQQGKNGYLANEKDDEAFAKILSQLFNEQHLFEKMGETSYRLFLERCSWDVIAKRYIKLIKES